ncbi:MAG: protein-glutamate O-methyltransferase [Deltaproteobacteria bacterium]|nr:protein-glutamate O-methyltransferase [Deltaproteobacteria bacterium]
MLATPTHESALRESDYRRLRDLLHERFGLHLPPTKKVLLQARIQKRLRRLKMGSFAEYCEHLFSPEGLEEELPRLVDVVTTHKTEFFRESGHFEWMVETLLPELSQSVGRIGPLKIWSAGCSTGEEVYSLAMLLSEWRRKVPDFDFEIIGSDVAADTLEKARQGIYRQDRIVGLSDALRRRYFMRSKDRRQPLVRVVPELRSKCRFELHNLIEEREAPLAEADLIFCRNVMIYFDRPTRQRVVEGLVSHLAPWGTLFVGHAETLGGIDVPLLPVAAATYRHRAHLQAPGR